MPDTYSIILSARRKKIFEIFLMDETNIAFRISRQKNSKKISSAKYFQKKEMMSSALSATHHTHAAALIETIVSIVAVQSLLAITVRHPSAGECSVW